METTVTELRKTSWANRYTEYLRRRLEALEVERAALKARLDRLERLTSLRVV